MRHGPYIIQSPFVCLCILRSNAQSKEKKSWAYEKSGAKFIPMHWSIAEDCCSAPGCYAPPAGRCVFLRPWEAHTAAHVRFCCLLFNTWLTLTEPVGLNNKCAVKGSKFTVTLCRLLSELSLNNQSRITFIRFRFLPLIDFSDIPSNQSLSLQN